MSYIHIFGEKLDAMLAERGVSDADRQEIIAYVKHIVLESYNNGRAVRDTRPQRRRNRSK